MSEMPRAYCAKCGRREHSTEDCPSEEYLCFNCKEPGHWSAACLKPCFNCKEPGHRPAACPKPRGFGRKCFQCGEPGHIKASCPKQKCFRCNSFGHASHICPIIPQTPARCFKCGSLDHMIRECPLRPNQPGGFPKKFETKPEDTASENKPKSPPRGPGPTRNSTAHAQGNDTSAHQTALARSIELNKLGNIAFVRKEYKKAADYHSQAIALCPEEAAYLTNRATSHLTLKDFRSAMTDYRQAMSLRTFRPSAKTFIRLAQCQVAVGYITPSLITLKEALSLEPTNDTAKELKAKVITLNNHVIDFFGARSRNHWRMAQVAYENGCKVFNASEGDLPTEWLCWGIEIEIARGNWDVALHGANKALLVDPNSADAMVLRGVVLLLTAQLSEALQQVLCALRLDPDNLKAKNLRLRLKTIIRQKDEGNAFFRESRWDAAIGKYSEALKALGEDQAEATGGQMRAILLSNRATALYKLGRVKEAYKDINCSLSLWPSYSKALRSRGRINMQLENFDAAADDFREALDQADPELPESDRRTIHEELRKAEDRAKAERNKTQDFYAILGLSRAATVLDIKKAYRKESLKHHPDKGGCEEKFKLVAEAYATLSDVVERSKHDADLDRERSWY